MKIYTMAIMINTTISEVRTALSKTQNGRSPGPGDIPVELLKAGGRAVNEYWISNWRRSKIYIWSILYK